MCDYKKPFEQVAAQDSRNVADLFNKVGWQGGEDEAKHNVQNPGRAITKSAISAALWYLGSAAGEYWGGAGAGAGGALGAAADTAGTAATQTAEQIAAQAAQDAAESGGTLAVSAAGNLAPTATSGLLSAAPQGLGNTLDATLQDSGYTPSSLLNAFKNASTGNGTPLGQNLANYGTQLKQQAVNGGLLNRVGSNLGDKQSQGLMKLGAGLASPQQQQRPAPSPMPQQAPQGPLQMPYQQQPYQNGGGPNSLSGSMPPPGMSYSEWLRRKQMGLLS